MVNDLIGGQFANNLRHIFGMPDPEPAPSRGQVEKAAAPGKEPPEDGTAEPTGSDVAGGASD